MRKKISTRDFDPLSIIGRGAFGEVRICRHIETGEVVAVKRMKKAEMINKNQVNHIKAEREVLVKAKNDWIVDLKFSFQEDKYLYLVMDFLPGGDLMTILMRKDILTEDESRFYIAETILSIESVHKVNYIHRDLKPANILIDKEELVKLTDFGLCKHAEIRPTRMTEINTKELSFNFN
jgi:serine/threonine kinase 38